MLNKIKTKRSSFLHTSYFRLQQGFTLAEMLITAGLIIFLTSLVLPNYRVGASHYALQRSSHKLTRDLRMAQEMAVSARGFQGQTVQGGYGLYFQRGENAYILFADTNSNQAYDGLNEKVEELQLEKGIITSSLSSGAFLTIIFVPPDPVTLIKPDASFASITLNNQKTVKINKAGLIEIE